MGKLETKSRQGPKRTKLHRLMLKLVAAVDALDAMTIEPRMIAFMRQMGYAPKKRQREFVSAARRRLVEKGLIHYRNGYVRLTKKGELHLRRLELENFKLKKPNHWDGKWRILIFDIPEYRKNLRAKLRRTLSIIGFLRLQDSVWLYPYDCEELIAFLKVDFKLGDDLLYIIADAIERDIPYRAAFSLPLSE